MFDVIDPDSARRTQVENAMRALRRNYDDYDYDLGKGPFKIGKQSPFNPYHVSMSGPAPQMKEIFAVLQANLPEGTCQLMPVVPLPPQDAPMEEWTGGTQMPSAPVAFYPAGKTPFGTLFAGRERSRLVIRDNHPPIEPALLEQIKHVAENWEMCRANANLPKEENKTKEWRR